MLQEKQKMIQQKKQKNKRKNKKNHNKESSDRNGHLCILADKDSHKTDKYDYLAYKLKAAEDKAIHVINIRCYVSLNDTCVSIQIVLVRPLHEVDHHAP